MKKKLFLIMLFLVVATVDEAYAVGEYWEDCSSCTNNQKKFKATQSVPDVVGTSYVYITDFDNVTLKRFRVYTSYLPGEGGGYFYFKSAFPTAADPATVDEFVAFVNALNADMQVMQGGISIHPDIAPSVYDVMFCAVCLESIALQVSYRMTFVQQLDALLLMPMTIAGLVSNLDLVITVTFEDGSSMDVRLNGFEQGAVPGYYTIFTFEYVEGSARDSDGNPIPESASEAAPYVAVSSSESNAEELRQFILSWYAGSHVTCSLTANGNETILRCGRELR